MRTTFTIFLHTFLCARQSATWHAWEHLHRNRDMRCHQHKPRCGPGTRRWTKTQT